MNISTAAPLSGELFAKLHIRAEEALDAAPQACQAIAMIDTHGKTVCLPLFFIPGDCTPADYETLADQVMDTLHQESLGPITHLVALWQEGRNPDLPAFALRRKLLALCPENRDALILLLGEGHFLAKPLSAMLPPKN